MTATRVSVADYRALSTFRHEIRKFLAFSEQAARSAGVEPQQHQALLSIRGLRDDERPTIGAIADRLCVQHHTAVALVDKLEENGLVVRERSEQDRREVLVRLTTQGTNTLAELSLQHREHLKRVGPQMVAVLSAIVGAYSEGGAPEPELLQSAPFTARPLRRRTKSP